MPPSLNIYLCYTNSSPCMASRVSRCHPPTAPSNLVIDGALTEDVALAVAGGVWWCWWCFWEGGYSGKSKLPADITIHPCRPSIHWRTNKRRVRFVTRQAIIVNQLPLTPRPHSPRHPEGTVEMMRHWKRCYCRPVCFEVKVPSRSFQRPVNTFIGPTFWRSP